MDCLPDWKLKLINSYIHIAKVALRPFLPEKLFYFWFLGQKCYSTCSMKILCNRMLCNSTQITHISFDGLIFLGAVSRANSRANSCAEWSHSTHISDQILPRVLTHVHRFETIPSTYIYDMKPTIRITCCS